MSAGKVGKVWSCAETVQQRTSHGHMGLTGSDSRLQADCNVCKLDLLRNLADGILVLRKELFDLTSADLRCPEALLLQLLRQQIFSHLIAELTFDTRDGHPVQFLKAAL